MPQGTPNLTNQPTPFYAPGEIGCSFNDQSTGAQYLRVRLDSGAVAAASQGVVAAGQLAFWKDRGNNLVTNDPNFNDTGTPGNAVNRVAGIFQTAVTAAPGQNDSNGQPITYVCDIMIQGQNAPVQAPAGSGVAVPGYNVTVDTTTYKAKCLATATTAPVSQVLGVCRSSAVVAGLMNVDVNIGFVD
jgi:hypothetical protein